MVRSSTVGHDVASRMVEAVSGVSRMREFRRYVADTAGRRLVQLWMDIERFHRVDAGDERSRWLLYREIQISFYQFHDAPPSAAAGKHHTDNRDDVNTVLVGMRVILLDFRILFNGLFSGSSLQCLDAVVGRQEGHPACKKLHVGGDDLIAWSYSSSVTIISYHHCSNKIKNGDILIPANPGTPGKWPLNRRELLESSAGTNRPTACITKDATN